jgi:gamma-glutamylputrescine oxidase
MYNRMTWQSPISPGISWYETTIADRPRYERLDGDRQCDVVVIGGGFTGLQAACGLAQKGVSVTLIDAHHFGDGGSGRNGGQMGTGQRWSPDEMESELGFERSKGLFDMAENAKRHLLNFAETHGIDIEYMPGQLNVSHKKSYERDYRKSIEAAATRYGYPHFSFMDRDETVARLGSTHYHFGIRDVGTGHIQPMKLLTGLARAAHSAGANLHEETPALKIESKSGKVIVSTGFGTVTANRGLIACNAHINGLEPVTTAHVMPIRSFIGATVPLDAFPSVIPGNEAIADSRFVVRYFRKSKDGRLLFGGREAYTADSPRDISEHIRRQITEIYPELANIEVEHSWGGSVGITLPRQPFVRDVLPGVTSIGGFSGHGVMLSNYCGKLYADLVTGGSPELELIRALNVPAFPGGARLRKPLLFLALTWFSLMDRL